MTEVVFDKTREEAEGWMERYGGGAGRDLWHPGCCHICGSGMLVNNAGHDNSNGDAYEGCTMAGCRRRKEIKQAGPCRSCDHLMGYLDQGPKGAFRSLPVPTGHLASDCPLSKGTTEHPVGLVSRLVHILHSRSS